MIPPKHMRISKSIQSMSTKLYVKKCKLLKNMQDTIHSVNIVKRVVLIVSFINILTALTIYAYLNNFVLASDVGLCQRIRDTEPTENHVNFLEL